MDTASSHTPSHTPSHSSQIFIPRSPIRPSKTPFNEERVVLPAVSQTSSVTARQQQQTPTSTHVHSAGDTDSDYFQRQIDAQIQQIQQQQVLQQQEVSRSSIYSSQRTSKLARDGIQQPSRPYTAGAARLHYALRMPVPVRPVSTRSAPAVTHTLPAPPTTPGKSQPTPSPRVAKIRGPEPQQTRYGTPTISQMIATQRVAVPASDYEHGPSLLVSPRGEKKPYIPDRAATATPSTSMPFAWMDTDRDIPEPSFRSMNGYSFSNDDHARGEYWQRDDDETMSIHSNDKSLYGSVYGNGSRATTPFSRPYVQSVASERLIFAESESTIASGRSSRVSVASPQLMPRTRVKLPITDNNYQ